MQTHDLNHVILSWPKHLADTREVQKAGPRRSWIQLAKTGTFHSNRYGKFAITKNDLSQMLTNFNSVTPKSPTELPIDYDHLSMDPKKPGDGIAAGWMKQLELREDGNELWAEVEWTEPGAERIEKGEYRFVSPSFVKDHTHKDGRKIGTTLLAAAITNHPFLEGMSALTLYNFSVVGDLALQEGVGAGELTRLPFGEYEDFDDCVSKNGDKDDPKAYCAYIKNKIEGAAGKPVDMKTLNAEWAASRVVHLSEVGQRVMIAPGHARTMDETGGTFEIVEVVGQGDDAFVVLKDANGVLHKWFRSTELLPASATPMPAGPNLQPGVPNAQVPPGTPGVETPGAPAHPDVVAQVEAAAEQARQTAAATGATPEEQEAAAETARQEAMAQAQAQQPTPGATPENADPAAAAAAAAADGKQGGEGQPAAKGEEEPAAEAKGEEVAGGEGTESKAAAKAEKTVEVPKKTSENGAPDVTEPLKKAVGALMGKPPAKKVTNMTKFMLRNDKNEEIEVTAAQLEAAGIRVVPEGSTVIGTKELGDLQGKVTSLSSQVETLAAATELSQKTAAKIELKSELDRLSSGGFITKPMRDYAEKKWADTTDLSAFKEWAAAFTTQIVQLNTEHGSGSGAEEPKGEEAGKQIITLANTIAKERGISLRDAMIQASAQLPEAAKTYRESFANVN